MAEFPARIRILQDTAANFISNNPILLSGEWGYETDTGIIKVGDGSTAWGDLESKFEQVFTAVEKFKLASIETDATADQTGSEIKNAYEAEVDTNAFTDAEKAKLGEISAPDEDALHFLNGEGDFVALPEAEVSNNVLRWV